MKYTREKVNDIRKSLNDAYDKIEMVYNSIETQEQYNTFYNMCQCVIRICTFWDRKLRPRWPLFIHKKELTHYEMFSSTAMNVVEKMNNLIDMWTSIEASEAEYMQKYNETEERLRIEREIINKLNKEQEQEEKSSVSKIGFVTGETKKKRKYTKKKKDEI